MSGPPGAPPGGSSSGSSGGFADGGGIELPWIAEVRQRLELPAPKRLPAKEARQAAVLVPLYVDAGQLWTLLTRRTEELPHHKGQIAFPGGGRELGETAWEGALREAEEELGIDPEKVVRLGRLDEKETPSGYRIVPCVGAVPFPLDLELQRDEIAEAFPVPLLAFHDVRVIEDRKVLIEGREREIRIYHVAGRRVWGLTARIVQNLMQRLGLDPPAPVEG